jgi:hypothetical protein
MNINGVIFKKNFTFAQNGMTTTLRRLTMDTHKKLMVAGSVPAS